MYHTYSRFKFKASVMAVALAAAPALTYAAGLGKLTVVSGLGQSLRAEVELAATNEELSSLAAKLASPDAFKQAGIEFNPALAALKFSVAKRPDGRSVVRMSSDRPINEPFVDVLIELNWAAGRLVREYTFLLDPPESVAARQPAPVAAPTRPADSRAATTRVDDQTVARARAQSQGEKPAVAPSEQAGTREVKRGDTLHRIASETKPEGVTLDQMLVALFRGNKDAFDGSMHRLKAGKILKIPDRETVAAVSDTEARRVVVTQSADFNAYRQKLAAAAASTAAPKEQAAQQAAAGKITPKVEDKAPAPADAKDQLKVSKGEVGKADKAAQARISALEEDLIAKDKALKEANTRLSQVEKNIQEMQKLIELKNQNLAQLQKQAATKGATSGEAAKKPEAPQPAAPTPSAPPVAQAPAPVPAPPVAAPAAIEPKAEPPKTEEKAVEKPPEAAATPQPSPPPQPPVEAKPEEPKQPLPAQPTEKPAASPPASEEPGFLESLGSNPATLVGGGALALLLGYAGYKLSRRRKEDEQGGEPLSTGPTSVAASANSVFGATGGQSVDTSGSSIQTDFSQSGIGAIDADEGVDPVAEADVYMAYGRDAQAEEILLDALKSDPTRHAIHVKLLEIYAQRKNVQQFETLAGELYAQTGGVGAEWEKAAAIGHKLDPTNPLYGGTAADTPKQGELTDTGVAVPTAVVGAAALKDTWTMPGELGQIANAIDNNTLTETSTFALPGAASAKDQATSPSLDFDLGAELPAAPEARGQVKPLTEDAEAASLDFDLGLDFPAEEPPRPADQVPDVDKTVILDADRVGESDSATPSPAGADQPRIILPVTPAQVPEAPSRPSGGVDVDFTTSIIGMNPSGGAGIVDLEATDFGGNLLQGLGSGDMPERKTESPSTFDLEKTDVGANLLDFDFDLGEPSHEVKPEAAPHAIDLSSINLDLDEADKAALASTPVSESVPSVAASDEPVLLSDDISQEVETKLELAHAYEEMGDKDGARELLQEVLKEGNVAQQEQAHVLLAKLG